MAASARSEPNRRGKRQRKRNCEKENQKDRKEKDEEDRQEEERQEEEQEKEHEEGQPKKADLMRAFPQPTLSRRGDSSTLHELDARREWRAKAENVGDGIACVWLGN